MNDSRFPFPDRDDCKVILERDPCYNKIPPEKTDSMFNKAWDTGVREARSFLTAHRGGDLDMELILKEQEFQIQTQDIDYVMGKVRYFCEVFPKKSKLCIYKKSVQMWAEAQDLPYEYAKNIILAHEYFHYLEAGKIGWVSKQCMVPMLIFGNHGFGKTGVAALSEIAANAFANEYYLICEELKPPFTEREEQLKEN